MNLSLTPRLVTMLFQFSFYTTKYYPIFFYHLKLNHVFVILICSIITIIFIIKRPKSVYLVDFACYKPEKSFMCSKEFVVERLSKSFNKENASFLSRVLENSGLGQQTYLARTLFLDPIVAYLPESINEAKMVMFGAIDELLSKTGVSVGDIGIFVLNSSLFNSIPSLSSMVINRYKLRSNILSYNLSGMGCSAGVVSVNLARQLLQIHSNSYALVVSCETVTPGYYNGNDRSMLIAYTIFRMGGAAILLSNRSSDRHGSKYKLVQTVGVHMGHDDTSYNAIFQQEDNDNICGVKLSKDIMAVAGEALKMNIKTLGPLIIPFSEQLRYFVKLLAKKGFKLKMKSYVPNFKLAIEHFCIHPGGKGVLDEIQKRLELSEWHLEPSRMSLYRFGNTSASGLWYELAYSEAKGRVKKGDRVWQIALGSGFKCYSAVWHALRNIDPAKEINPWMDEINEFPAQIPKP